MNILQQLEGAHRMMLASAVGGQEWRTLMLELRIDEAGNPAVWYYVGWDGGSCRTQSLAEACRVYERYAAKAEAA